MGTVANLVSAVSHGIHVKASQATLLRRQSKGRRTPAAYQSSSSASSSSSHNSLSAPSRPPSHNQSNPFGASVSAALDAMDEDRPPPLPARPPQAAPFPPIAQQRRTGSQTARSKPAAIPRSNAVSNLANPEPLRKQLSPIMEKFRAPKGRQGTKGDVAYPPSPLSPTTTTAAPRKINPIARTLGMKGSMPAYSATAQPFKRPMLPTGLRQSTTRTSSQPASQPSQAPRAVLAQVAPSAGNAAVDVGDTSSDFDISLDIDADALEGICSKYDD